MQVDIRNCGTVADSSRIQTAAIQKAIDTCAAAGGGEVVVSPGRYVTGTLRLKTGVTLHLAAGASLIASGDIRDYPMDVHKCMCANAPHMDRCLIFAQGASGIGIVGRGRIDGQGGAFPNAGDVAEHRPMAVRLVDCNDVLMRDVTLVDSASWAAAVSYCDDVCVDNVRIHNRSMGDGVGLAIDGCRDVRVSSCSIDAGSDAIWLQTSRTDRPCERVAISNCTVSGRGAGIRVGLLSVGTIRDVVIGNCVLRDIDDVAVAVQVNEGGVLENVRVANLVIRDAVRAAFISLNRHRICSELPPVVPPMGALRNVHISGLRTQMTRSQDRKAAFIIVGASDAAIENVSIQDVDVTVAGGGEAFVGGLSDVRELGASRPEHRSLGGALPAYGLYARHVRGLNISGVRWRTDLPDARPAMALDDVTVED